jgi:DNA repair protein RadD
MTPRDYQAAAVASLFAYFSSGKRGNPLIALPTGTGKSIIIADFIQQVLVSYPTTRVMMLTHVRELIEQNHSKLLTLWPLAPAGIYSAGLNRKDRGYPILFGGVSTVAKADPAIFGRIDLLLIDECHLVSPKDETMYRKVIESLSTINPALKVVGLTATPYRLGHGMLVAPGGLFTDTCFDLTGIVAFNWLLSEGYLSRLIPKQPARELDLTGVHIQGGDYKQNELQAAVDKDEITFAAVREIIEHGAQRHHWLVFASGVEHAIHIAAMFESLGVAATFVHSKMASSERDANIAGFKSGKYRVMVNNGILTTGFDFPAIDMIAVLRPTMSASLWVQMLGRGTRPMYATGYDLSTRDGRLAAIQAGQKQDCLVLDFAGNTRRLGPINDPVLPRKKGEGGGIAPVRLCETCGTYNHASVRVCVNCGAEFPREVKIQQYAGTEELIASTEVKTETFKVDRVVYTRHTKEGRPPTIQVSYFCGLRLFREWVCLEHEGFAGKKARDWWRARSSEEPPVTTADGLSRIESLATPTGIVVWLKPKYDEILSYIYGANDA